MIRAIFYSKFDVQKGPTVIHQVPNNSITPSSRPSPSTLLDWSSISSTVIPRQSFCSLPLSLLVHPYRVLSHPICLYSESYPRNEFIFSFSLVLHHRTATPAYASVVSKIAELFKRLEEDSFFLSRDASAPNTGRLYALCEILLEDLNNYCETMIPIDESNTLNIKLFPTYPPPPGLKPHYAPLPMVRIRELTDANWDLTMLKILPFLDGVNSIRTIARKADADYGLVKQAVQHMLYYGVVTLLDIFTFSASYAPTPEIDAFIADRGLWEECRRYVILPQAHATTNAATGAPLADSVDYIKIIELYTSMQQGLALRNWCLEHADVMGIVDVRRLVTFGVVRGFLYRVHKYAITTIPSEKVPKDQRPKVSSRGIGESRRELEDFLDGKHCFDEICTELVISEKELLARLKTMKDVQIIQK